MSIFLLDVNVLMALAWPTHVHHAAAHRWLEEQGFEEKASGAGAADGWATCPLTELGFVRLSMQPAVVKVPLLYGDAAEALARSSASAAHEFWPLESRIAGIREEIRARIVGHHQLADALLLDLAIRRDERLATFDRKILGLLPPDSPLREAVVVIPV